MIYYFPIDKIRKNETIILYGIGMIGRNFVKWNNRYNYCTIKCIIDQKKQEDNYFNIPIVDIEEFAGKRENFKNNKIVITSIIYRDEMVEKCHKCGVEDEKIIFVDEPIIEEDEHDNDFLNTSTLGERDYWGENGIRWYKRAESCVMETWNIFKPIFEKYQLYDKCKRWLEFGCGEGRIINCVKENVERIYGCDINKKAIEECKRRFKDYDNVKCFVNSSNKILMETESIDFVYSIGTMVSFDLREMNCYMKEIKRVLRKNGFCVLHHSNWRETEDYFGTSSNRSLGLLRGDVGAKDVELLVNRIGFELIEQIRIPWGGN